MKILLVKMSSMGDIFHTFPAITDLRKHRPDVIIDWVVEESFAEIAAWHPAIRRVIPIRLRQWVKKRDKAAWQEFKTWRKNLRAEQYDLVVDAQGLLKSALVARCANSKERAGYDRNSAREPVSNIFYKRTFAVSKEQHAVERSRRLLASVFDYQPDAAINFGINQNFAHIAKNPAKLIFIIGTSWVTKLWATAHWIELANTVTAAGFAVEIIWGSDSERAIADEIISACPAATRPDGRLSITTIAGMLVEAAGVIGLDTGFSHLAGALETPTLALYGATSPTKVGLIGEHTSNVLMQPVLDCMPCHKRSCRFLPENSTDTPPCMTGIAATRVWQLLQHKLAPAAPACL